MRIAILAALTSLGLAGTVQAQHYHRPQPNVSFGFSYGGNNFGYSNFNNYRPYGNYGYGGGYNGGYGGYNNYNRGHHHYYPSAFVPHGNHYHYVPGHTHYHR